MAVWHRVVLATAALLARVCAGAAAGNNKKPNIIVFMTDDQDMLLGGSFPTYAPQQATPMPITQRVLYEKGAHATNFVIHTPICCPSRSETMTGRYLHNVKLPVSEGQCTDGYSGHDNKGNPCCMHVDEVFVNNFTFIRYLHDRGGYRTGMFGKYLNVCPIEPPPGFDAWYANGGSTYTTPTFNVKNIKGLPDGPLKYDAAPENYSTSLIGNVSIAWMTDAISNYKQTGQPFFAYIGPKANHEPFTPAAWYQDVWEKGWPKGAPRTPNFNVTKEQRALHHPNVANRSMITDKIATCIDQNFQDRWRCLLSVDDLIGAVVELVEKEGVDDNTYIFYTSDHGYQQGQLNLNMDKRNMYDTNIRIHLLARGPGIKAQSSFDFPATNVDLGPTILGLAGIDNLTGVDMDGRDFSPMIVNAEIDDVMTDAALATRNGWRDHVFVEYYYVGIDKKCGMEPIEGPDNNFIAVRHFADAGSPYGDFMYAEFQTGEGGNIPFDDIAIVEAYDMAKDPWQLHNIYSSLNDTTKAALHSQVQQWLHCKQGSCQ